MNEQNNGSRKDREDGTRKELIYLQPVTEYPYAEGDEISLVDFWIVMARRKALIFGIMALCVALGIGYAFLKPVKYEYRTGIELARVHGGPGSKGLELLSPKEDSIILLRNVIIPSKSKALFGEDNGPKVKIVEKTTDYSLMLKSEAEPQKSEMEKKFHKTVAEALAKRHQPVLEKKINVLVKPFQNRVSTLREQISSLENELQRLYSRSENQNEISNLISAQQMGNIRQKLAETRVQLMNAKSATEVIKEASHPTRISFLAVESKESVGTGKKLITALSLVLGLMLGLFAAFFREFLNNVRAEKQRRDSAPGKK